jgi:hypothetical protein
MLQTLWAVVHEGKLEVPETVKLPEGAKAIVTLLPDDESQFWAAASEKSLAVAWDNAEDDVYAQLL